MEKVFMYYRGELPVKIEFRPNYILISSKSRRAKKWADRLIKKEAKKSNIILKKKKGRYYPKDLKNYIQNQDIFTIRAITQSTKGFAQLSL